MIWDNLEDAKLDSPWLWNIETQADNLPEMSLEEFTAENIKAVVRNAVNWKVPGFDNIQNFSIKRLPAVHALLAYALSKILNKPETIVTSLLPC